MGIIIEMEKDKNYLNNKITDERNIENENKLNLKEEAIVVTSDEPMNTKDKLIQRTEYKKKFKFYGPQFQLQLLPYLNEQEILNLFFAQFKNKNSISIFIQKMIPKIENNTKIWIIPFFNIKSNPCGHIFYFHWDNTKVIKAQGIVFHR